MQYFPIWDKNCLSILSDDGQDVWMSETDVRRNISQQKLGVYRPRNSDIEGRKIFLKVAEEEVFDRKLRRLDAAQPFCVRIQVGDRYHAFMHVARRCEASYDGRSLFVGIDERGEPVYAKRQISSACL
jgi:hypothetical protein